MSRPTKYNEKIAAKFVGFIEQGVLVKHACKGIGISEDTYMRWRQKHPDFNKKFIEATERQQWESADALKRYAYRTYTRKVPRLADDYGPRKPLPSSLEDRDLVDMRRNQNDIKTYGGLPVLDNIPSYYPTDFYINSRNGRVEWRDKNGVLCSRTYAKHLEVMGANDDLFIGAFF